MAEVFQVPKAPEPSLFQLEDGGEPIALPPFAALSDEQMAAYIDLIRRDEPDMSKVAELTHLLNPALDSASALQKQWIIGRWNEQNKDSVGEFLASS